MPAAKVVSRRLSFGGGAGTPKQAQGKVQDRGNTAAQLAGAMLAGGLAFAPAAHAQTAATTDTTLPPLEVTATTPTAGELPAPYAGGQVAKGGSLGLLGTRDTLDTPFSTMNYTSELIENQQGRTAADTLINDASVRLTTGSNGFDDTFQIRGYAVPSGDVGFNGLYGLISSNRVPSQLVERMQLLKGPSALANGIAPGGSIGGGINILTKRAGDEPLTRLTTTFMSESNFGLHADVGRRYGLNKEWGIRFNGLVRDGEVSVKDGNLETTFGALGLDYRGERLRWSLDAIVQNDETENFRPQVSLSSVSAIPSPPDARGNWYPGTKLLQKDKTIATNVEYDITESLTAYAGIGRREGTNDQTFPSTVGAFPVNAVGNFRVQNNYYDSYSTTTSGTVGARWKFNTLGIGHTLNVGYTGFQQEAGNAYIVGGQADSNIYNPSPLPLVTAARTAPRRASDTTLTSIAVADTLSFANDRILLTLGVRDQKVKVESYNAGTQALTSTYDASSTSPLAAIVVKPWSNVAVYANYAQGLSRGTTVGVGYANTGEVLAPFKSEQYEVGVKVDWGSITTTAAIFELTRPSLIGTANTVPLSTRSYDGEQRNRGLELNAYGQLLPGLRGFASATFLDPELTKTANVAERGNDPAGVPDMTFSAGLDWDTPWVRGLALNGRVIYTSGSYLSNANTLKFDSWTRLDIGARYATEVVGTPVTLRANVENVFDKDYWLTTGTYVTVGAPRTFILSAAFDF